MSHKKYFLIGIYVVSPLRLLSKKKGMASLVAASSDVVPLSFLRRGSDARRELWPAKQLSVRSPNSSTMKAFESGKVKEKHSTRRPLPREVIEDGLELSTFDDLGNCCSCEAVAEGAQAFVYALDYGDRKFAVKVLKAQLQCDPEELRAFGREAQLLARLSHAHVNGFFGVGAFQGRPSLLLEWVDKTLFRAMRLDKVGGSRWQRREIKRQWPNKERLRLALEFAKAMAYLHSGRALAVGCFVLHRDLKPDNLGISFPSRSLKLLDFGLAVALEETTTIITPTTTTTTTTTTKKKIIDKGDDSVSSTEERRTEEQQKNPEEFQESPQDKKSESNDCCGEVHEKNDASRAQCSYILTKQTGSLRYMAPEVARGTVYGLPVDVYSFAVTCWEFLALRGKPYDGLGAAGHAKYVVQGTLRPDLPTKWAPNLQALMQDAWKPKPRDRPTFDHVLERLTEMKKKADRDQSDPLSQPHPSRLKVLPFWSAP